MVLKDKVTGDIRIIDFKTATRSGLRQQKKILPK